MTSPSLRSVPGQKRRLPAQAGKFSRQPPGNPGAIAFITVPMLGVAAIALFLSTIIGSALGLALGALAAFRQPVF